MLIADRFVFLHASKMGGTFVTEALTDIYSGQCGHTLVSQNKHGGVAYLPPEHASKQLVTTLRNPYDYYASVYQFGWWIGRDLSGSELVWEADVMRHRFPHYPYITFEEYMEGVLEIGYKSLRKDQALSADLRLGALTVNVISHAVPGFLDVFRQLREDGDLAPFRRAVARVKFLHVEALNRQMYQWLLELDVPQELAEPVLNKEKVRPLNTPDGIALDRGHGQPRTAHWSEFFNERTRAMVAKYEWLFFELFPEYAWAETPNGHSTIALAAKQQP